MSRAGISIMMLAGAMALMTGCKSETDVAAATAATSTTATSTAAEPAALVDLTGSVATVAEGGPPSKHRRNQAKNTPGSFDYYLLTLSWSPEFCVTHPDKPECAAHPGFVLHGLWPENNDGSFPDTCSTAPGPANPAQYNDIYPDQGLLAHEWTAHGTCSALAPDQYFAAERSAVKSVSIPQDLQQMTAPMQLTPQQIITDFAQANPEFPAGSIAVSCGNNRLTAVQVCLSKGLTPVACQGIRSCRANVVKITPPGQ